MTEELRHLPRHEKKHLVKGWHNCADALASHHVRKQNAAAEPDFALSSHCEGDQVPASLEVNDRLMQWLRQDSAASSVVSSQWRAQFASERGDCEDQEDEVIPLTSGQVKHAYRTRARKEEIEQTKKAVDMKIQREKRSLLHRKPSVKQVAAPRGHMLLASSDSSKSNMHVQQSTVPDRAAPESSEPDQDADDPGVHHLKNLPAHQICVDTELRNEILASIRKQLVAGRDVLLSSDVLEKEGMTLSDVRLMLQQLCSQSLMYCIREQEVVPQVESRAHHSLTLSSPAAAAQRVSLRLESRIRSHQSRWQ